MNGIAMVRIELIARAWREAGWLLRVLAALSEDLSFLPC